MNIRKISCIATCFAILAVSACKSTKAAKEVTSATADVRPAAPAKPPVPDPVAILVSNGLNVYQSRCYQCHELPRPGDYNQSDWSQIMIKMSRKAHLSNEETDQILAYINSVAKP